MSLTERDYILRMIEQLGLFLARITNAKTEGDFDEALEQTDKALEQMFGPLRSLMENVDALTAANLLGNAEKTRVYAALMAERADIHRMKGDAIEARIASRRALELYLEAYAQCADGNRGHPIEDTILPLRPHVNEARLSERYRQMLSKL